jgi:uncharacterized membrane protein YeaQ/YmgE (transglycosylase-associated protein family)
MSFIGFLISLVISGLVVGALARLALPGKDPMTIPQTILIGIAGSFVGGLIVAAVTGGAYGGGIVVSVLVATFFVYLVRRRRGGRVTSPPMGARRS